MAELVVGGVVTNGINKFKVLAVAGSDVWVEHVISGIRHVSKAAWFTPVYETFTVELSRKALECLAPWADSNASTCREIGLACKEALQ